VVEPRCGTLGTAPTLLKGHLKSMVTELRDDAQEALGQGRPSGTARRRTWQPPPRSFCETLQSSSACGRFRELRIQGSCSPTHASLYRLGISFRFVRSPEFPHHVQAVAGGSRAIRNVWSAALSQAKNERQDGLRKCIRALLEQKAPGLDGMRCARSSYLVMQSWKAFPDDRFRERRVRPLCHLIARQQTSQKIINSLVAAGL
jgi:hypothetical protein